MLGRQGGQEGGGGMGGGGRGRRGTCRHLECPVGDCKMSTLSASCVALAVPNMEAIVSSAMSSSWGREEAGQGKVGRRGGEGAISLTFLGWMTSVM